MFMIVMGAVIASVISIVIAVDVSIEYQEANEAWHKSLEGK